MKVGDRVLILSGGWLDGQEGAVAMTRADGEEVWVNPDFGGYGSPVYGTPFKFSRGKLRLLESTAAPEGPTISVRSTIVVRFETLDGFDEYDLTEAEANALLSNLMAVL